MSLPFDGPMLLQLNNRQCRLNKGTENNYGGPYSKAHSSSGYFGKLPYKWGVYTRTTTRFSARFSNLVE